MRTDRPAGVILVGGRSSRMGVSHKALLELIGRPLLARVIDRLQPQLGSLLLSCETDNGEFDRFGLPVVPDLLPDHRGPLTGLCSALQYLEGMGYDNGLALCPCDAPFVPDDLVQTLLDAGRGPDKPAVIVSFDGVLQPTFSLWHTRHLPVIREAVVFEGIGGLRQVLSFLPHRVVEWAPAEPPPFFNINTPADLVSAADWLDRVR